MNKGRGKKKTKVSNEECLKGVKNMTENKKLDELNEEIELLKTELNSLLSDKKPNENYNPSTDCKNNLVYNKSSKVDQKSAKYLESGNKKTSKSSTDSKDVQVNSINSFMPGYSSTPVKFSNGLSVIIDEINVEYPSENESHNSNNNNNNNNKIPDSKLHALINKKSFFDIGSRSYKSNASSFSEQKIEQLLYKSLVLKTLNSDINLPELEEGFFEGTKSFKTKKHHKYWKFRKNYRSLRTQTLGQRQRKRRINLNSSHSDVEIINLDSSGNYETSKIIAVSPESRAMCVDLDISNCDWSEPFDLDSGTGSHSNERAAESDKQKKSNANQKLEYEYTELMDSTSYDEIGKGQSKKSWECPVCFERSTGQEIIATQCGHVFCKKCVESHFLNLGRCCPSCRTDLMGKPIITLFNF